MQYRQPPEEDLFFGDPMPFYHDSTFHVYYLLDPQHHQANNRLGGAQVAHVSSRDLVHWQEHPIAIPTGPPGSCDQYCICTGSPLFHDGTFYFWYATRMVPEGVEWRNHSQHVCLATSNDAIHFEKAANNPILNANAQLNARHFRDPFVFREPGTGLFHMLVTSQLAEETMFFRNGALAHLTSSDLHNWDWQEPFLVPGLNTAPECPDHFEWNGWYYLTFLVNGQLRYRMSRQPLGPWTRPAVDTLDGPLLKAMKTAAFNGNRRIGVGFLSSRSGYKDAADICYAGNAIFRDLKQRSDGTLSTCWPAEMLPETKPAIAFQAQAVTGKQQQFGTTLKLSSDNGIAAAVLDGIPLNTRIGMTIKVGANTPHVSLLTRGTGSGQYANEIRFSLFERRVTMRNFWTALTPEHMLDNIDLGRSFTIDLVQTDSVVDLLINGERTFVTRLYDNQGERLFFMVEDGDATFADIMIEPL